MMPSSAESYERVFAALKKTQPSLLENAGNAIFAAAKGMFGPKQNAGGASGKSNPKMGGMPAAANDIKKSASPSGPYTGVAPDKVRVRIKGTNVLPQMDRNQLDTAYKAGKIEREDYSGAIKKLKDKKSSGNSKRTYKVRVRTGSGRKSEMMDMKEIGQAFKDKKITATTRDNARTRLEQFQMKDASSNMQNGRAAAIGQGATRASSASSGGSPTIVAPSTTNISSPTNNSSSYSTPMSNMPVSPAAQIIRNSLNF
jgi:hypothetical protein